MASPSCGTAWTLALSGVGEGLGCRGRLVRLASTPRPRNSRMSPERGLRARSGEAWRCLQPRPPRVAARVGGGRPTPSCSAGIDGAVWREARWQRGRGGRWSWFSPQPSLCPPQRLDPGRGVRRRSFAAASHVPQAVDAIAVCLLLQQTLPRVVSEQAAMTVFQPSTNGRINYNC